MGVLVSSFLSCSKATCWAPVYSKITSFSESMVRGLATREKSIRDETMVVGT